MIHTVRLLLVASLALAALACGPLAGRLARGTPEAAAPARLPLLGGSGATLTPGGSTVLGGYSLTVLALEDPARHSRIYQADSGKRLVAVEILLANDSPSGPLTANPFNATLVDAGGHRYPADIGARIDQLDTRDVASGERVQGWIAFKIPDAAVPAALEYEVVLLSGRVLRVSLFK